MGMFVEYDVDGHAGQTKVWNEGAGVRYLETYKVGDEVPILSRAGYPLESETYSVSLAYGDDEPHAGYLNVHNRIITGWSHQPEHMLIMSSYGEVLSEKGI